MNPEMLCEGVRAESGTGQQDPIIREETENKRPPGNHDEPDKDKGEKIAFAHMNRAEGLDLSDRPRPARARHDCLQVGSSRYSPEQEQETDCAGEETSQPACLRRNIDGPERRIVVVHVDHLKA